MGACKRSSHAVVWILPMALAGLALVSGSSAAQPLPAWNQGRASCQIVLPGKDERASRLVRSTINEYLQASYGVELPVAADPTQPGTYILAGTPANNERLAELVRSGVPLAGADLGDEGFQILTAEHQGSRYVIIHGATPRALKHGCQELVFYRLAATTAGGMIDWPMNVVMKPQFAYRGSYMLPCWSAMDSFESWARVLRFNSELTLNRNWFWLDGFPVAGHTGEYAGTALADATNVQRLLDLVTAEDMKILIGGGWFTWHHEKAVGKDLAKGIDYYLAYLDAFKNFHGFYIEPTGEGAETASWARESEALFTFIGTVLKRRPEMEFALAIGQFNNPEYQQRFAKLDPNRVFWWWCWGDPIRDKVLDRYPSVLRWHVITHMSGYHGSMDPPQERERPLTGMVTSFDPGQGFGNPWDGWGKLGVTAPRNFHPYTIPYFGHEYFWRERCWDVTMDERVFTARLQRRLFDADAPPDAGQYYWRLTKLTLGANQKQQPAAADLDPVRTFIETARSRTWTPRTTDTLARMNEAVVQLAKPRPAKTKR